MTEEVSRAMKAFNYAKTVLRGPYPEGEDLIASDPEAAYHYANFLHRRWPKGEPAILTSPMYTCSYVLQVIGKRWPEAEPTILKSPFFSAMYAIHVIGERWPEAEPLIATDPSATKHYTRWVLNGTPLSTFLPPSTTESATLINRIRALLTSAGRLLDAKWKFYGGGRGMSYNAQRARASGKYPKTAIIRLLRADFGTLNKADVEKALEASWTGEWHHTGPYAAETKFYSYADVALAYSRLGHAPIAQIEPLQEPTPAYAPPAAPQKPKLTSFVVGQRVRHPVFGTGVVRSVDPSAVTATVTVDFDEPVGSKKLALQYAQLTAEDAARDMHNTIGE